MTNGSTDDYPRCGFCGKTLFFLDGHYRCPEESSHGWHRETIERKGSPKTPETLAELRRLLDCSSKLPWECYRPHFASGYYSITASDGQTVAVEAGEYDAELIAAAVNALPGLLDAAAERDALAAGVERVRALADEWTYNGEFGWDDGSHAYGPDCEGQALDYAAAKLRRALDEEPQS